MGLVVWSNGAWWSLNRAPESKVRANRLLSRFYQNSCDGDCGVNCSWFWLNKRKSNSNFQGGVPSLKSCYFCCCESCGGNCGGSPVDAWMCQASCPRDSASSDSPFVFADREKGLLLSLLLPALFARGPVRSGGPTDSPDAAARQCLAVMGPIL